MISQFQIEKLLALIVMFACAITFLHYHLLQAQELSHAQQILRMNELARGDDDLTDNIVGENCDPIIANATQFRVLIDGVLFPQIIPSYFNVSLNFTCMRARSRKKKIILLWHK